MEQAALIVGLILAVYGMIDLTERFARWILFPRGEHGYRVVPLCGSCGDVEYIARRLELERKWLPFKSGKAVLVDCGLDEGSRRLAIRVCEETHLRFCDREKLCEILTSGLQEGESVV